MKLVMKVGGASGPLYGTLFMALGKELPAEPDARRSGRGARRGDRGVKARGKSEVGQKTMLDVLVPVQRRSPRGADAAAQSRRSRGERGRGDHADEGDPRPRLVPGRALDRPHRSRRALQRADDRARSATRWSGGHDRNVGIVIVSHSPKVAEGAADMVRQMVGDEVPLAWCGGNPDGGLGTSVESDHGGDRAGLVGGGRGHPGRSRRGRDQQRDGDRDAAARPRAARSSICNAPIVEGAVMAATEASGGASLEAVAPPPRSCRRVSERDMMPATAARSVLITHAVGPARPPVGEAHQARQDFRGRDRAGAAAGRRRGSTPRASSR